METFPRDRRLSPRLNLMIKHYPGSLWSCEQHERRMQYQCAVQGYPDSGFSVLRSDPFRNIQCALIEPSCGVFAFFFLSAGLKRSSCVRDFRFHAYVCTYDSVFTFDRDLLYNQDDRLVRTGVPDHAN